MKKQSDDKISLFSRKLILLLGIFLFVVIFGWIFLNKIYPPSGWTLFIYKNTHIPSTQIQKIAGYDSKEECIADGYSFSVNETEEVFECGYRCTGDYAHTCKETCDEKANCLRFR